MQYTGNTNCVRQIIYESHVLFRRVYSSLVAHLAAVAATRVRIPASSAEKKYKNMTEYLDPGNKRSLKKIGLKKLKTTYCTTADKDKINNYNYICFISLARKILFV